MNKPSSKIMATNKKQLSLAKKKILFSYSQVSVVPIDALCFLCTCLFYTLYLFVSFIQILKTPTPVFFYFISILFKKETINSSVIAYILSLTIQLAAIAFEVIRLIIIKIVQFSFNLVKLALGTSVGGVVKDLSLIAFSWWVIEDAVMMANLIGYGIAFLGLAYFDSGIYRLFSQIM